MEKNSYRSENHNVVIPAKARIQKRVCASHDSAAHDRPRWTPAFAGVTMMVLLSACTIYPPTPKADYTIKVTSTPNGSVAVPPTCLSYATDIQNPYDNQPQPQFGCATSRNLAMSVERPDDLVKGRELGPQRAVTAVGAMRRYDNNQTRGLLAPSSSPDSAVDVTTSSTPNSSMTGDVTGATGATSPAPTPGGP